MQMVCTDSLLQMYVEGAMSAPERAIVEAHLAECDRCRAGVDGYKALMWDIGTLPEPELPAELAALSDRLMEQWEEHQAAENRPQNWVAASLLWTRTVPVVHVVVATAGNVGRSLPAASASLLRRLGARLLRGGGAR